MRRLAKQSRNDTVASKRDYQELHPRRSERFEVAPGGGSLTFLTHTPKPHSTPYIGFGAYLRTARSSQVRVSVTLSSGGRYEKTFALDSRWHRVALLAPSHAIEDVVVEIHIMASAKHLDIWGLNCGIVQPVTSTLSEEVVESLLQAPHLEPETFFLPHDVPLGMASDEGQGRGVSRVGEGATIFVKKCAYCQRLLPVDPKRLGSLAFHKHNAKKTKHQNECRACKKWRINDSLNQLRTVDQLHESSVITRERQILLREPEILQRIKDRTGAGLKSIIWRRFSKKCFRCDRPLELDKVQLDHTRPLAYLWPIDKYATCLCAGCNNFKKDRFPVDVYTEEKLAALAATTGLGIATLKRKAVNFAELRRIQADIATFSQRVEPRTFNAIARKVQELLPHVRLYDELRTASPSDFARVVEALASRPDSNEIEDLP